MSKILVTGGCGYIGSHTIVDLIENGYEVISVDNNSRSSDNVLKGIEQITGKKVKNYKVDLCNFDDTFAIFQENEDINGIIHFAAYKSVGESVKKPLMCKNFKHPILFFLLPVRCMATRMKFLLLKKLFPNQQSHLMGIPSKWVNR